MSKLHIERVDSLPVIIHWLLKMQIQVIIDRIWYSHNNWKGLSYGQLAVLFIVYVIHQRSHRLSRMEGWVKEHHLVLEQITGWEIGEKDATDDRLGLLLEALGSDEEKSVRFQRRSTIRENGSLNTGFTVSKEERCLPCPFPCVFPNASPA